MKCSPVALGGAAWVLLLFGTSDAHAELIQWSYNWSRTPTQVAANSPGTGYISLTDQGMQSAAGNSYLVATNLQAHSTATLQNPDVFTNKIYTLSLYLQDTVSGKSGTLSFTGELNGTLTADNSNISNKFLGQTTQSVVLGNNLYTVTIGPYTAPGPTGAVNSGSIAARAQVQVSTLFQLPEPSSCLLAVVGALGSLAYVRLRRRDLIR